MRLAFFGTPDFAIPTLERLLAGPHEIVSVVSQPDRRRGRGRKTSPSPVADVALRAGLTLLRPEKVGADQTVASLRDAAPDLGVVVAFGQFIPKTVRELPTYGYCINGHASLLPKFRGAAPIAHAILAGEAVTGVTVMRVEKEMDAGAMALTRETQILREDNTATLTARLAELTADAIAQAVDDIANGTLQWTEQDHDAATFAPKIERSDAWLDFSQGARALACRVRAMAPKPGATTWLEGETLRILDAASSGEACMAVPGTLDVSRDSLRIATGDDWLDVLRLQRAGGKPLDVAAFLNGSDLASGSLLGVAPQ